VDLLNGRGVPLESGGISPEIKLLLRDELGPLTVQMGLLQELVYAVNGKANVLVSCRAAHGSRSVVGN
jgi:hypothetical protein